MSAPALRRRLLLVAIVSTLSALAIAGVTLSQIFLSFATQRVIKELDTHLGQLAGVIEFENNRPVKLTYKMADPKFEKPLSGLYWQVNDANGPVLRSRSLWDNRLEINGALPNNFEPYLREISSPTGASTLMLRGRTVVAGFRKDEKTFHLFVAIDKNEIDAAHTGFIKQLAVSLGVLAGALIFAAWLQISVGLRPLDQLRRQVESIQSGTAERLTGKFPFEVERLVGTLNGLLDAQDDNMARARARAGSLAHGLKTPLAVLSAEGRALRKKGQADAAAEIDSQVEQMRRNVERELARSRERPATGSASTAILPATTAIVAAMKRLPRGGEIRWFIDVPEGMSVPIHNDDFNDIVGNLLDNARKWADNEVRFSVTRTSGSIELHVQDDGPGIPENQTSLLLERGQKLDPAIPGAGLGLAIVQDVLDVYEGHLAIQNGHEAGLLAIVHLPG